jgi:hypothetical protein
VRVWRLQSDGTTTPNLYEVHDHCSVPPYTPHLVEAVEECTVLADWSSSGGTTKQSSSSSSDSGGDDDDPEAEKEECYYSFQPYDDLVQQQHIIMAKDAMTMLVGEDCSDSINNKSSVWKQLMYGKAVVKMLTAIGKTEVLVGAGVAAGLSVGFWLGTRRQRR